MQIMLKFILLTILLFSNYSLAQTALIFSSSSGGKFTASELVLTEAYARLNIPISIVFTPAERSLRLANRGIVDGEVFRVMGIDDIYTNLIRLPVPINTIEIVAFVKNKNIKITNWDDLRPYRVGIRRGVKLLEKATSGMIVFPLSKVSQLFSMLEKNRLDVIIVSKVIANNSFESSPPDDIYMLNPPLAKVELYHYIHKKHIKLVPAISQVLKDMEQEGFINNQSK